MTGEDQYKYMPLSNGFLAAARSWIFYILIVVGAAALVLCLPEFWRDIQTGDIVFSQWISANWIWPIILLNLFSGRRWFPYRLYILVGIAYMATILSLEISDRTLNLSNGLGLGFGHWMQIFMLAVMIVLLPFLFLKRRIAI